MRTLGCFPRAVRRILAAARAACSMRPGFLRRAQCGAYGGFGARPAGVPRVPGSG